MPKKREYLDVLGILYTLMRELGGKRATRWKRISTIPSKSPIFQKFPKVLKKTSC